MGFLVTQLCITDTLARHSAPPLQQENCECLKFYPSATRSGKKTLSPLPKVGPDLSEPVVVWQTHPGLTPGTPARDMSVGGLASNQQNMAKVRGCGSLDGVMSHRTSSQQSRAGDTRVARLRGRKPQSELTYDGSASGFSVFQWCESEMLSVETELQAPIQLFYFYSQYSS